MKPFRILAAALALAGLAFVQGAQAQTKSHLQTVLERVLDEVSFGATDRSGETVRIDGAYVEKHLGDLARNADLSKFIL